MSETYWRQLSGENEVEGAAALSERFQQMMMGRKSDMAMLTLNEDVPQYGSSACCLPARSNVLADST